jgi:cobalt-zinc-cadmium efflux system outer membrane protein
VRGRFLFAASCTVAVAGCVHYTAQPLTPEQGAADVEGRTLGGGTWDRARLMAAAVKMHPDMEVARAKLEVAKAAVITAGASPNPTIGYSATNTSRLLGGVPPWTNGFILDVPIETAGKRGHRIAQAQALLNGAALDLSSAERKVQTKVRSSLFTLFAAQQREELSAQQQSGQEEAVKLFDARIAAGEVSRAETLQAHLLLNQSRLQNREAQKLAAEARVTLAGALGVSVHALEQVRLSFAGLDTLPHPNERQLRRAAMLQRPDVLSSLAAYAAAEAALRLEIARQWPDLHLGPGYSYDQGQDKWTIGFTLTLPVFDQNRGPIAEALAKRREAAASFIAQQAKALSELELALASYRGALTKLETAGQLLTAQERQQRSAEDLFKAGENDRLTLVSAQVELQAARLSRLDALIEAQQALGALEDASGLLLNP